MAARFITVRTIVFAALIGVGCTVVAVWPLMFPRSRPAAAVLSRVAPPPIAPLHRSEAVIEAKIEREAREESDHDDHADARATGQNYDWRNDRKGFSFDKLLDAKRHVQQMPAVEPGPGVGGIADAGITNWDWLGPGNIGGRIRSMVIDPTDPQRMYIGGVGGGIWRTVNAGFQWVPLNDFLPSLAVSTMVMDPADPDTIYAGTGENFSADGLRGAGVFKTTDGGDTWVQIPETKDWSWINRIAIDPDNSNHFLVAVPWGVYYTQDGFTTSPLKLQNIDIRDVRFKPTDGTVAVAGTRDGRVFYSLNGGLDWDEATWTGVPAQSALQTAFVADADSDDDVIELNSAAGFSKGNRIDINDGVNSETVRIVDVGGDFLTVSDLQFDHGAGTGCVNPRQGRVELAFVPSNPFDMYLSMNVGGGTIYRSAFDGRVWELVSNTDADYLGTQGDYDNTIWVAPDNEDLIVVGGIDLWRSTNGGQSFSRISRWQDYHRGSSAHADNHFIVNHPGYDGVTNKTVYFCNDGGIQMTDDVTTVGQNSGWVNLANNLGITQFYAACASARAEMILGGTQDNSVLRYREIDGAQDWYQAFTGDGGFCAIDDRDAASPTIYTETQNLHFLKSGNGGASYVERENGLGDAHDDTKVRFVTPFTMDPNDPATLVVGGTSVWRTTDSAITWGEIRPPLPTAAGLNPPECNAVAIAPLHSERIWVGYAEQGNVDPTTVGRVSRTTNIVNDWVDVDVDEFGNDLLPNRVVTDIAINPIWIDEVFVTFAGYNADSVWFTPDNGATWQRRTGTPPFDLPAIQVNAVTFHPGNSDWVYVGTDLGVFASEDKGLTWRRTTLYDDNEGPVNTQVVDVVWQGDVLVAATHGRGMYRVRPFVSVYADAANAGFEDGSFTYPFDTVGEAAAAAGHGTEVVIRGGTYDEPVNVLFNKRGMVRALGGNAVVRR